MDKELKYLIDRRDMIKNYPSQKRSIEYLTEQQNEVENQIKKKINKELKILTKRKEMIDSYPSQKRSKKELESKLKEVTDDIEKLIKVRKKIEADELEDLKLIQDLENLEIQENVFAAEKVDKSYYKKENFCTPKPKKKIQRLKGRRRNVLKKKINPRYKKLKFKKTAKRVAKKIIF